MFGQPDQVIAKLHVFFDVQRPSAAQRLLCCRASEVHALLLLQVLLAHVVVLKLLLKLALVTASLLAKESVVDVALLGSDDVPGLQKRSLVTPPCLTLVRPPRLLLRTW